MGILTKTGLAWALLAWLATTWIGALMGFLFAWAGILIVGGAVTAFGGSGQADLPDPSFLLWSLWACLLALASIRLAVALARGDHRRAELAGALLISLFGILLVVHLSLDSMKSSWPRG